MKYFFILVSFILSGCMVDTIDPSEFIPAYNYSYKQESPGSSIIIGSTEYFIYKVPVYDPLTGSTFAVTIPSTSSLSGFSLYATSFYDEGLSYKKEAESKKLFIGIYPVYIYKNCYYSLSITSKEIECNASIFIDLKGLVVGFDIEGSNRSFSESIDYDDYDLTIGDPGGSLNIDDMNTHISEFINYINIERL